MEKTSNFWDLNIEVESLEKASFLTIKMHLTILVEEMGEGMHERKTT